MKKKAMKLTLNRETLQNLQPLVSGGTWSEWTCVSVCNFCNSAEMTCTCLSSPD